MTVRVSKPALNVREKISELDNPVGNHGAQLMKSVDAAETFNLIGAGRKNIVINGDMRINQRYASAAHSIPAENTHVLDRWAGWSNISGKFEIQRVADAPSGEGLVYSAKCTSSANTTAGNSDWYGFSQRIEGYNVAQGLLGTSKAKTFTLSFWVKSSLTGSWYGAIRTKGSSPDRSYPFEYTINTANTWEKKTLTFPGAVDGTWGSGTSEGMCLWWDLGTGSTFHGDGYEWHSANKTGIKASPFIAVSGATWYITGVQLELGTVATPFEHRSYAEELALCQRYYWKPFPGSNSTTYDQVMIAMKVADTDGGRAASTFFPVMMRAAPSVVFEDRAGDYGGTTTAQRVTCQHHNGTYAHNVTWSWATTPWGCDGPYHYPYGISGFTKGDVGNFQCNKLEFIAEL